MMEHRKHIEQAHYEAQAALRGGVQAGDDLRTHGSAVLAAHIRPPYAAFENILTAVARPGARVLDLGSGTGVHSLTTARAGALTIATDISVGPLRLALERATHVQLPLLAAVTDAEALPIASGSIDIVTCAGALYCFDIPNLLQEITRVLKPDGMVVIVDPYNHNPIYRANRLIGFLRGRRTLRAVTHVPNRRTIDLFRQYFTDVSVTYFGVWTFLWPVVQRLLGTSRATAFLLQQEPARRFHHFAFKIVLTARGLKHGHEQPREDR